MSKMQDELKRELLASPNLFPMDQSPDGQWVHFLRLTEEDYRQASFLDSRLVADATSRGVTFKSGNIPWDLFQPWMESISIRCHFIFHISHAGSTMLARMLGEHPQCFAVREPRLMRSFVDPAFEPRVRPFLALWSRVYRPEQTALIKATSFVSEAAERLMQLAADAKAICMHVPVETFLASVLDGSMSDIESLATSRYERLKQLETHGLPPLEQLSSGEKAAMSWFVEMKTLEQLQILFPSRTISVDFDQFLGDPMHHLRHGAEFFGLMGEESRMLRNDILGRYAKKPEVTYDQSTRRRLLDQSKKTHATELEKGLRWLASVLTQSRQ